MTEEEMQAWKNAVVKAPPPRLANVLAYSKGFVGIPYKWGGSHPYDGYDCSGFVQELLASVGLDPPGDQTAQSLYDNLKKTCAGEGGTKAGSILFFGSSAEKIVHVAFAVDKICMLEAGGGDHLTLTKRDAIERGAFIRLRPIDSRKDLVASLFPPY